MKVAFVDTLYLVALFNRRDQWHERAIAASHLVAETKLITTEDVLVELLNFFSEYGEKSRRGAVTQAEEILNGANIEVAPQSHDAFLAGLSLYKARPDKGYSLTDCISMHAMRERGVSDILTHDDHFRQEGFTVLL
ncbi:MAG TPA: PIN domain-containing protein [Pyrinomonadaceae bacterium]|nr:PIN domain-containing protein [Pyrinomonadaceae bacterium]